MANKDMKREAKKDMLRKLKKMMRDDMHEPMKGSMKKVTVASDSEEGLKEGLSKAQEIMKMRKEMMDEDGDDYACGGSKKYADGGYADYVRSISGAAVSKQEAKRLKENMPTKDKEKLAEMLKNRKK